MGEPFFDPGAEEFLANPHRVFDALRPTAAVVRDPLGWSTLDYASSEAAFHDPALVPGIDHLLTARGIGALWGEPDRTLTDAEGEAHQRLRRAVSPWFSARRIAELRDRTSALIGELLDAHDQGGPSGSFDLMRDLSDVVPARLFCWMVGAPESDAPDLIRLSKALLSVFTATEEMVEPVRRAKAELALFTEEILNAHRNSPATGGDDLTSALLSATTAGSLAHGDAFFLLEELLSASVDNTANTAALAVLTLATQPGAWNEVHENADLVSAATEECGRFEPAIRHTIKAAVAPTVLAGQRIEKGEFVTIRIAAAHRDPEAYPAPHRFDPHRLKPRTQLAFGAGRHYCLGAALGRMEVVEMVRALTVRWSSCEVADEAPADLRRGVHAAGVVASLPLNGRR